MTYINDWKNIAYLKNGNIRQQKAYRVLTDTAIMDVLSDYDPILTGTIPIEIDIASSDLDIICSSSDLLTLQSLVKCWFANYASFSDSLNSDLYVASFIAGDFEIEIYAQSQATIEQNAYRHMLIEHRLLSLGKVCFCDKIIELKEAGYKTEPAFGKLLGLSNPFDDLLCMENLSDKDLVALLSEKGYA